MARVQGALGSREGVETSLTGPLEPKLVAPLADTLNLAARDPGF